MARWRVHGERYLYRSPYVDLALLDVQLPDGERYEHHAVRMPRPAAAVVVHDPRRGVLLLHRHRVVPDRSGWEVPAGRVEEGEDPLQGACREVLEETGWRPARARVIGEANQVVGICDLVHVVVYATGAVRAGDPDPVEADEVRWVRPAEAMRMIRDGEMPDGTSQHALLLATALGLLGMSDAISDSAPDDRPE